METHGDPLAASSSQRVHVVDPSGSGFVATSSPNSPFPLPHSFLPNSSLAFFFFFPSLPVHFSVISFPLFLLRPQRLGSIGTREGVIQKNLSGLLPVRDFRMDPSLLYSLPLLALSPNLLVVWIFLSVAFLLAKLRCS